MSSFLNRAGWVKFFKLPDRAYGMTFIRRFIILLPLAFPVLVFAQPRYVSIRIVQDEAFALTDTPQNNISLEKKSFKIQVVLQNVKGVYVFASPGDSLNRLSDGSPVPGFDNLPGLAMKEEVFNREKELLVSDGGWSYWFYDPKLNWHRFNRKIVLLDSDRVVCTKTIKQLYFVSTERTVKLKDNDTPIYLFFVAASEIDSNGKPLKELFRRKVRIEWNNED